jgi:uncharacterized protein
MNRLLQPFVLAVTAILLLPYVYLAWRLGAQPWQRIALAIPFVLVWIVPVVYWGGRRARENVIDQVVHQASYLCMAWISFLLVFSLARDVLLIARLEVGVALVLAGSLAAVAVGALAALRGPHVKQVDIAIEGLHPDLQGYRIVQISDLHVGPTIGRRYVERVVRLAENLAPDLVALTGDMVDGPVARLAVHVAPLERIAAGGRAYFVLGNHDCYAGADAWIAKFRGMGMRVLLNEPALVEKGGARVLVGGVVDPTFAAPRPDLAAQGGEAAHFRLLLAHNPRIAPLGARAGFDLQISGHTHAGQFFPWTLAVRLVHAPHVAGLSREGRMQVYVSAGTGTWGPPVRFGTSPELTLIRLVHR